MVGTRKSRRVAADEEKEDEMPQVAHEDPEDSGSDSDEAPEEVTFVKSKKSAATRRQQEQEAKQKASDALKERRKRRQRTEEPAEAEAAADSGDEEEAHEEDEEPEDMLPDEVLEAIVGDESRDRRLMEKRVISEQLRMRERAPKQRRTFSERQAGPVTVQVLRPGMKRKPSEAARAFLAERLHGGVKRSNEMLQPTKIGGMFVFGPKAK